MGLTPETSMVEVRQHLRGIRDMGDCISLGFATASIFKAERGAHPLATALRLDLRVDKIGGNFRGPGPTRRVVDLARWNRGSMSTMDYISVGSPRPADIAIRRSCHPIFHPNYGRDSRGRPDTLSD